MSEKDILDKGDDDFEVKHDHELEVLVHYKSMVKTHFKGSMTSNNEIEKQHSKKEKRKRNL